MNSNLLSIFQNIFNKKFLNKFLAKILGWLLVDSWLTLGWHLADTLLTLGWLLADSWLTLGWLLADSWTLKKKPFRRPLKSFRAKCGQTDIWISLAPFGANFVQDIISWSKWSTFHCSNHPPKNLFTWYRYYN